MKRTITEVPAFELQNSEVVAAARLNRVTWKEIEADYALVKPYIRKSPSKTPLKAARVRRRHEPTLTEQLSFKVPYRNVGEPLELPRERRLFSILAAVPGAEQSQTFTPIFPSYTSLLRRILDGTVSLDMLRRGLFCFACTEGHAKDLVEIYKLPLNRSKAVSSNERNYLRVPPRIQALVQSVIIGATIIAEDEGRIQWREVDGFIDYENINELLNGNGFVSLDTGYRSYSYGGLTTFVDQSGQYLRVFS